MNIKETKIWAKLRKIRGNHILLANYKRCLKMPENQYEDYLSNRFCEMMQRYEYTKKYAHGINFSNPSTYCEKLNWLKLYDQDNRKTTYADKYEVRNHIEALIGKEYLVPLISIDSKKCFENVKEIDFKALPNSFVIKCTHGSHMNIIVKDKTLLAKKDFTEIRKKLKKWMRINYAFYVGLELHYKNIKPRIIIEEYLKHNGDLPDYKFFCFDGEPKFFSVNENRTKNYTETYFDINKNRLEYSFGYYNTNNHCKLPNIDKMISIAKKLADNFKFVRVDLYLHDGKIYFGELTFSPGAGFEFPNPYYMDEKLSNLLDLNLELRESNKQYRK